MRKTSLEKYGYEYTVQNPNRQDEFQIKRRKTRIKNGYEVSYKGKTAKELAKDIGINLTSFHKRVRKLGLEVAVKTEKHTTYLESILSKWFDKIKIKYQTQFYIKGKIADFYFPDYNLLIETDGLYWHSDAIMTDNNYHVKKRQLYIDNGYTPLFFREDELNNKLDIIKSVISNKLGNTIKLGARQCVCERLDDKDKYIGRHFCRDNHLMGNGKGNYFVLKYEDNIVCVICIKRVKDKDYEISRFCSLINYSINGAFSRLMKFAQQELSMNSLTTFIDLRYGSGSYLTNFGFQQISCYPSFRWTNNHQTFHRLKFPSNSGYNKGFAKIWDCGQAKWVKTF
ncbi:hypothetical protein LCGC14_2164410 [marine sediment metagenome]|uniref:DUF559 domain-containing protein n=1 Tax=marine sediment metagenome TaxID=412755 RepID=A0A0F9DRW7_9ZZZZ